MLCTTLSNGFSGSSLLRSRPPGLRGKTFRIIKFRTMVMNAENIGDGLRVSSESDPRITRVGRVLRGAAGLDELPQLMY